MIDASGPPWRIRARCNACMPAPCRSAMAVASSVRIVTGVLRRPRPRHIDTSLRWTGVRSRGCLDELCTCTMLGRALHCTMLGRALHCTMVGRALHLHDAWTSSALARWLDELCTARCLDELCTARCLDALCTCTMLGRALHLHGAWTSSALARRFDELRSTTCCTALGRATYYTALGRSLHWSCGVPYDGALPWPSPGEHDVPPSRIQRIYIYSTGMYVRECIGVVAGEKHVQKSEIVLIWSSWYSPH
jgi:hypothetical protein